MQIRFRLPADETVFVGYPEQINQTAVTFINMDLTRWAARYNIAYTTKLINRHLYLYFDDAQTVSFFMLTYKPQYKSSSHKRIEIVDAQNNLIEDFLSV